jgi:aspartate racemase
MTIDSRKSMDKRRHYECMGQGEPADISGFTLRKRPCRRAADMAPANLSSRRSKPGDKFPYGATPFAVRVPLQFMADAMEAVIHKTSEKLDIKCDQNHIPGLFFTDLKPGQQNNFADLVNENPSVFDLSAVSAESKPQAARQMADAADAVVAQASWSPVPFHVELENNKEALRGFIYRGLPAIVSATIFWAGGMGPDATADAVRRTFFHNPNARICVDNNTNTSDRTAHYKKPGQNPCPLPELWEMSLRCDAVGAQVAAVSCNSAHIFIPALQARRRAKGLPEINFVHIAQAVVAEIESMFLKKQTVKACLFGTTSTMKSRMYPDMADQLESKVEFVGPEKPGQDVFMECVYDHVKPGKDIADARDKMNPVIHAVELKENPDVYAAVCTEGPFIIGEYNLPKDKVCVSSTDALAKAVCTAADKLTPVA